MNIRKIFDFQQAISIKSGLKQKLGGRRVKSRQNVASKQLPSSKQVQQKYRGIACKSKFFPPYLRQAAKTYVAASHSVARQETIEISQQRTALYEFLHKRSTEV